jgi:NADH-quinone oxidoreductase subunit G
MADRDGDAAHHSDRIPVIIDGKTYEVRRNQTIFQACRSAGIFIPALCFHPDLPPWGQCGVCVVVIDGTRFAYSCMQQVLAGMKITTQSPDLMKKASEAVEQFIDVTSLPESSELNVIMNHLQHAKARSGHPDRSTALSFDPGLCINCGRCHRMCCEVQGIAALQHADPHFSGSNCISCGQCICVCPTGALSESSSTGPVLRAIAAGKVMVLMAAPAVRVSIGEMFGEIGRASCRERV